MTQPDLVILSSFSIPLSILAIPFLRRPPLFSLPALCVLLVLMFQSGLCHRDFVAQLHHRPLLLHRLGLSRPPGYSTLQQALKRENRPSTPPRDVQALRATTTTSQTRRRGLHGLLPPIQVESGSPCASKGHGGDASPPSTPWWTPTPSWSSQHRSENVPVGTRNSSCHC